MNKFFTVAIGLVVSVVLIGSIFIPIVHDSTTETVTTDIEMVNENPVGDLRLSYAVPEDALVETFTFTVGSENVTIAPLGIDVPLSTDCILLGSDTYFVAISYGELVVSENGVSTPVTTSVTVDVVNNQVNGNEYTYVYYPDTAGTFANFQTYQYELTEGYAVGSFAKVGVISKNGVMSGTNTYGFTATVNQNEDEEYTGVTYDTE